MKGENGKHNAYEQDDFYQADDHHSAIDGQDFEAPEVPYERATGQEINWRASEYIHHDKGALWLVGLAIVAAVIVAIAIWLGQWVFAVLTVIMAVAFGVYGFRQPREVQYHLSDEGLRINAKTYPLSSFRSFMVIPDGAIYSIQLTPVKRFMPALTLYFAEDDGEQIVDILGAHLPMEQYQPDLIDAFMRKLRF